MKKKCNFEINPAFAIGVTLMWSGIFATNVLEVEGLLGYISDLICGVGVGIGFVGLLYGSAKTRPLFDRVHAMKMRLLGRGE